MNRAERGVRRTNRSNVQTTKRFGLLQPLSECAVAATGFQHSRAPVQGPDSRPIVGVSPTHKPRSSRRKEPHSILAETSQSLLTSAATVQGFRANRDSKSWTESRCRDTLQPCLKLSPKALSKPVQSLNRQSSNALSRFDTSPITRWSRRSISACAIWASEKSRYHPMNTPS